MPTKKVAWRAFAPLLVLASALVLIGGQGLLFAQPVADEPPNRVEAGNTTAPDYRRIALPATDVGDGWVTAIHVQNVGNEPTVAVLDFYSTLYPRLCPIEEGQNLVGTRCTGPIEPGTTWTLELTEGMDLNEAKSAVAYSVVPGSQDKECGGDGSRETGQPLAVAVTRLRTGEGELLPASSAYTGVFDFGAYEVNPDGRSTTRYRSFLPLAAEDSDRTHLIAIQNLGDECSTFERWYFRQDFPNRALIEWLDINPGATSRVDDVIWVPPFIGSAWVQAPTRSFENTPITPQPLAVVVDQWEGQGSQLMTYSGVPKSFASSVNHAPLIYKNADGWNTEFQIQNIGPWFRPITATVSFLDFDGNPLTTAAHRIEGWDSWSVPVQDNKELPGSWVGALRVHSKAASQYLDVPPESLSVVSLVNSENGQALSYSSLQPPRQGGVEAALPWLVKGYHESYGPTETTQTSRIILQNLNPNVGFTSFRIDFYGEETVLGSLQDQLNGAEVRPIDLREVDFLPDGFHGSALVHITDSTQAGDPAIGAIVIEEAEGVVSGDLARAYEGIPLASSVAHLHQVFLPLVMKAVSP